MRGFACLMIVAWCLSPAGSALADAGDGAAQWIAPRAVDGSPRGRGPSERRAGDSGGWTTVIASLTVVVVLIVVTAKLLRQRGLLSPAELPPEVLHVLGRKVVDYRHTIHLVRCGSRLLVLGSSQTGLTPLAEITDPAEIDSLVELCTASGPAPIAEGFGELIRRFRSGPAGAASERREIDPPVLRLRERLAEVDRDDAAPADLLSIREGAG